MAEPITDLPSGDPVPSAPAVPAAPAAKPTNAPSLRTLATALPASTDVFLSHLHRCLSTPSGVDTVLLLVCYTSRLASSTLTTLSTHALRRSASDWIALVTALPPRTTILLAGGAATAKPGTASTTTAAAAVALALAGRLKALSGLASEARMITRLWGLLAMYLWARGLAAKTLAARRAAAAASSSSSSEKKKNAAANRTLTIDLATSYTQLIACVLFQALENVAYLSARGVLPLSPAAQGRAFRWSSRFWAVHVGVEVGKLAAEGLARRQGLLKQSDAAAEAEKEAKWQSQFAKNLAWAPLTVHWSLEKGLVGETVVGLLGSIPGVIQIRDLWRETA